MNFTIEYNKNLVELQNVSPELSLIKKAAEFQFSLKQNAYTLCYLDSDCDPIAIDDEDDLAVCILEFSEMSKFDDSVTLMVMDKNSGIPRRRDTPKGSKENSMILESNVTENSFKKVLPESLIIEQSNKSNWDTTSHISVNETASMVSEKVFSIAESKISDMIESRLETLVNQR